MKKYIRLVIIFTLVLFVTGCGNNSGGNGTGTISCVSKAKGENPSIVIYETYEVENNKVKNLEVYEILEFDQEYLDTISLDEIIKIYKKDSNYKVEKVNSTSIKNINKNPVNVYENIESENMLETIRVSMEENEFGLHSFTCEIK